MHNENLHTHCKHKRVALKIKKDVEHQRLPESRNLKTLESYTLVTTNRRYLRQIYKIIEEVSQSLTRKNYDSEKG